MPMYDYKCPDCQGQITIIKGLAQLDRKEACPCGGVRQRQISAPRIVSDYAGYKCPITGDWIHGRKAHRENLAKHGCRVMEPGEKEAASRFRQRSEDSLINSMEETVEKEIHEMSPQKRDALAADLEHFSADVVRT